MNSFRLQSRTFRPRFCGANACGGPPRRAALILAVVSLIAVSGGASAAEECVDYSAHLRHVTNVPLPGVLQAVIPVGSQAVVLAYEYLHVLDITEVTNPSLLGSVSLPNGYSMALAGDLAFIAAGSYGLLVADISDPVSPALIGELGVEGIAVGIAVSGDHVYMADMYRGLHVIDVSDPTAPDSLTTIPPPTEWDEVRDVDVQGAYAYVAVLAETDAFWVMDIADPTDPQLVATAPIAWAQTVFVSGDLAFAGGPAGLRIIDITDPLVPVVLFEDPDYHPAALSGTVLACGGRHIQTLDISDPANPELLGGVPNATWNGLAFTGTWLLNANNIFGLDVFDASEPSSPDRLGIVDLPDRTEDVVFQGDLAFAAAREGGLRILDISDRTNPVELGDLPTVGEARGVAVRGHWAYVAASQSGVLVVDVADPTQPQLVGQYDTPNTSSQLEARGDLVYAVDYGSGAAFYVIDVSVPEAPALLSSLPLSSGNGLAKSGNFVLLADAGTILIVDVSDPADPQIVGQTPGLASAGGVAVDGSTAWAVGSSAETFTAVDWSDPEDPQILSTTQVSTGWPRGIAAEGGLAYVTTTHRGGVHVYDVSKPSSPVFLGAVTTLNHAWTARLGPDFVIVSCNSSGVQLWPRQCALTSGASDAPGVSVFRMAAHPNPFRDEVTFTLAPGSSPRLSIFDPSGRLVRSLRADGSRDVRPARMVWDGRNEMGRLVSPGVYFARPFESGAAVRIVRRR
jgi:hypothetical protein